MHDLIVGQTGINTGIPEAGVDFTLCKAVAGFDFFRFQLGGEAIVFSIALDKQRFFIRNGVTQPVKTAIFTGAQLQLVTRNQCNQGFCQFACLSHVISIAGRKTCTLEYFSQCVATTHFECFPATLVFFDIDFRRFND